MLNLKEKLLLEIDDTKSSIEFYDYQLSFLNSLKTQNTEIQIAISGESLDDLFKKNRESKAKYMSHLNDLKLELATL